jgi:hypothetical protein
MVYVRSLAALLLLTVWSVMALFLVFNSQDTGVISAITPPVMVLVGLLIGGDLRKAWRKNDD